MSAAPAKCLGHRHDSPVGGYDYDCDHEFAGDITCDNCIFGAPGGRHDPRRPLEEQMSDMEVPDPLDDGPDDDRRGPELDDLEFEEGDFGEGYEWYITVNHELDSKYHKACRHCRLPTPEEMEAHRVDTLRQCPGSPYVTEPFFICPWTVNSVNEGGANHTSVCLQCIIEAGNKLTLSKQVGPSNSTSLARLELINALDNLLGWADGAAQELQTRPEALNRAGRLVGEATKSGPTTQDLTDALRSLVDWSEQAAAHLERPPQSLTHAIELLRMEDAP